MGEPRRGEVGLHPHEVALLALALVTSLQLAVKGGPLPVLAATAGGGLAYLTLVLALLARRSPRAQKVRLASAYVFALAFYRGVEVVTPALGAPLRDPVLLAIDRAVLGETPAVSLEPYARPWLTDLLSACYLTYHVYLHAALAWALWRPLEETRRLFRPLFLTFALGFAGYVVVPAVGPQVAYPGLFAGPLVGGALTATNAALVARGTSVYDVFPSLHVAITAALLAHDLRFARRRAAVLALPCVGLLASTLYLRYHYAVDLLAGVAVFAAARVASARLDGGASPGAADDAGPGAPACAPTSPA